METPDQLAAIDEVKADMEMPLPMDRVVCGDVGYGKTEMALRAAFKAVLDGKQVAVLVPTTLLARQHIQTFSDRWRSSRSTSTSCPGSRPPPRDVALLNWCADVMATVTGESLPNVAVSTPA